MPDWLLGALVALLSGIMLAAIGGNVMMYRQIGQLDIAIQVLTRSLENLTRTVADDFRESRRVHGELHARIDEIHRKIQE